MYKLIIAEDEELTREGIICSIRNGDTGFEVVGEAEDGEQALKLVKEKRPDVLVTDIAMPKLNGLELIEQVREESPETKIMIISGHDDFKYVQRAMQAGVQDYLLKPILGEQIREMLVKSRENIQRHERFLQNIEELKKQALESLPLVRERFFNELVSGRLSGEEIWKKMDYLKLDFQGTLFGIVLLKIKNYAEVNDPNVRKEDLIQYFLMDILDDIFTQDFTIHAFAQTDYQMVLLVCAKGMQRQKAFLFMNNRVSKLVASLQKYLNVTAFASIGRLYEKVEDFYKSYEEANEAMLYSFSKKSGAVINYEDIGLQKIRPVKKPKEIEEKLILHAKLCDKEQCTQLVQSLFAFYSINKMEDPRLVKMDIFEMVIHLTRSLDVADEGTSAFWKNLSFSAYDEIQKCDSQPELMGWTLSYIERCMEEIEKLRVSRSASLIDKVLELIELNLGEEKFSLDDVASRLYMSPNYLRQIFKQHTGESFVEYLTRVRMEKAADLLGDESLKIQQIAEKVGYSNPRYFAMCFKKYFQITPTDYRELNLQKDE